MKLDNKEELNTTKEGIYKFTGAVDEIECMDVECVIFDVQNKNHLPTKHCFVNNDILVDTLVVITPEKELDISARFIPEKNYMDIIELKEVGFEKEKTILTSYKINPVDSDSYLYQVQKQIAEPFEILLNNTPATLSAKCKIKEPLIEGKKYEFTYEKKGNRLEVIKIASVDDLCWRKNFLLFFTTRQLMRMNCLYDADVLTEDEKKINSFRSFADLCASKITDNPGMIVGFTGTVYGINKVENDISFCLKLSNEVQYKCIVIKSEYSNNSIRIQEEKRHYILGILSNGVIYVLISQRLREKRKRRGRSFIALRDQINEDKHTLKKMNGGKFRG